MPLISRYDNIIELILHEIPIESYIFGSFVRLLCFDHKFHQTGILTKECVDDFFKSGSDIDLFMEKTEVEQFASLLMMFGDVEYHTTADILQEHYPENITRMTWNDGEQSVSIDIVHTKNRHTVDFTCNNWMLTKRATSNYIHWYLECRVKFLKHLPKLSESAITTICYEDTLAKKINLMWPQKKIKKKIPKLVARTYKLLKKNFTFLEGKMLTKFPVPLERFKIEGRYDDFCPICLDLVDKHCAVLDCSHCLHATCMQEYCIKKQNPMSDEQLILLDEMGRFRLLERDILTREPLDAETQLRLENIRNNLDRMANLIEEANQEKEKQESVIECPICKQISTFLTVPEQTKKKVDIIIEDDNKYILFEYLWEQFSVLKELFNKFEFPVL